MLNVSEMRKSNLNLFGMTGSRYLIVARKPWIELYRIVRLRYRAFEPAVFAGAPPPEIAAIFAALAIGVNIVGWSILGVLVSAVSNRSVAGAQMG